MKTIGYIVTAHGEPLGIDQDSKDDYWLCYGNPVCMFPTRPKAQTAIRKSRKHWSDDFPQEQITGILRCAEKD